MTAVTTDRLIAPHGGTLVDRTGDAPGDLDSLEVVTLTSRELSDLDMIASGALSPLEGFMGKADYERVVEEMHLANGLPWALPGLSRSRLRARRRSRRTRRRGRPPGRRARGRGDVRVRQGARGRELLPHDRRRASRRRAALRAEALYLAGRVTVFERATAEFPELARDPAETRRIFAERGWRRVVGFQTRNPIHRAHEYLTKVALETVDGCSSTRSSATRSRTTSPSTCASSATGRSSTATTPRIASCSPRSRRRCATPARARRSGMRSAARTTAARTSSSAATTRASATTTAPTTRSSSSTSSRRTSSTSSRCSSSTRSGATSAARWRARSRARTGRRTACSVGDEGARDARRGRGPPVEFTRPEVAQGAHRRVSQ